MAISRVNRKGKTYFLHEGRTKTGKPRYFFSTDSEGVLAQAIPEGYEIHENPNGQVFLRKKQPKIVSDEEVTTVEKGVREFAGLRHFIVDVQKNAIVVFLPAQDYQELGERLFGGFRVPPALIEELQQTSTYSPMMRFILVDEEHRTFAVQRWCFRGSIDDWFPLMGGLGPLSVLVAKYSPHLGRGSFFELM